MSIQGQNLLSNDPFMDLQYLLTSKVNDAIVWRDKRVHGLMTDFIDRLNGPTSELRRLRETAPALSSQHLEHHEGTFDVECLECKEWREEVNSNLAKLKSLSENKPYSDSEVASVIATVSVYYSDNGDDYIDSDIRSLSEGDLCL